VEDGAGALFGELAAGEGADDEREGKLDGVSVFDGGEVECARAGALTHGADLAMAGVELVVEVAPELVLEGGRLAAATVGEDMAT
jgi:hypothetical protein